MADENTSGTAAAVDTSPSLVSLMGEMYGDYTTDAEPESDAGSTPAATLETPAPGSEGDAPSAPAGDPPAEADATGDPDSSTPDTSTDTDPLEGSTPLDYAVDGQSRSYDGITVLKDGGAVIDPDALTKVRQVFSERDHLYETSKAQYEKYAQLERLTTWKDKDAQGNERTLTGPQAVEASRITMARTAKALETIVGALADPKQFAQLHDLVQDPASGEWSIIRNDAAWKMLLRESSVAATEAAHQVRTYVSSLAAPPAPADPDVASFAMPTIDKVIADNGLTALTSEDKQFLASNFELFTRPATAQERQQYGVPRLVLPKFVDFAKDRNAMRRDGAKTVQSVTDAAKVNAGKLAAARQGAKGAKQVPKIAAPKPTERTRADDLDDAWDLREKAASAAMRGHATR